MLKLHTVRSKTLSWFLRKLRRSMVKLQYFYVNHLDRKDHRIALMNYGYVSLDPSEPPIPLTEDEEEDRCSIQLYHRVAGAVDLTGKDVLEIGCGRGGGAVYMVRALKPRSLTAIDLCKSSVLYCQRRYDIDGLTFRYGDAEDLDLPDESFDAVVNVESSHCYSYMSRFLAGVRRVLRPGGYFLYADFRMGESIRALDRLLRQCGMDIVEDDVINANVFAALERESDRKCAFIMEKVPRYRQPQFLLFAAVKGTAVYEAIRTGDITYKRYVLRKPLTDEKAELSA